MLEKKKGKQKSDIYYSPLAILKHSTFCFTTDAD
jgi:hypothetical protein